MIKTLSKAQKMEREKFRIPRSVQDAIPIRRIFADGIFQVGNQYSKTWSFTDINYAIASKEDKTSMFLDYSELLNALDSGASAKITIYNRRINKAEFEKSVLLPDKADGLDEYRHEFNKNQQEFDHLLEMSLDFDENTPFLDDKLKRLSDKIKQLKTAITQSSVNSQTPSTPTNPITAKDLLITEYDDMLTARIIEKIIVKSRQDLEIIFIGGYTQQISLQ